MHICSEVQSDALDTVDSFDAIEAVLPAGTLSGAPRLELVRLLKNLRNAQEVFTVVL